MGDFARKADGWRVFTAEFKRTTLERIRSGETTLATIARELDIQPAIIRRWMKLDERGSTAAVQAGEEVVHQRRSMPRRSNSSCRPTPLMLGSSQVP